MICVKANNMYMDQNLKWIYVILGYIIEQLFYDFVY